MTMVHSMRLAGFISVFILFSALYGRVSCAHVSADSMPDSVAEVEYRIYLEFKPNDLVVLNKLGMVYYRLDKLSDAVREFSKVLKTDSDNYDALDGMGLVKAAERNYDEAVRYHRQAISINGEDMITYYHLGSALEKKGDLREAVVAYRTALEKYNKQYPPAAGNAKAAEFAEKVRAAIRHIEAIL